MCSRGLLIAAFVVFVGGACGSVESGTAGWLGGGKGESSAQQQQGAMSLTIAHLNDTHAQVEPMSFRSLLLENEAGEQEKVAVSLAGFPRLVAKVRQLRRQSDNVLVLHAGDVFQGSLYFTKYQGLADLEFLEMMPLDAMAIGNHEFDQGPATLAAFAEAASMPLLAANLNLSNEPRLGKIRPYTIAKVGGYSVGIIGLLTPETPTISSPGETVAFNDPVAIARDTVQLLQKQGVNKIILLSHLGYEKDVALAQAVAGVDVIVGGHTHTQLGQLPGLASADAYPVKMKDPAGDDVCVVQAGSKGRTLGKLDVSFDRAGVVTDCSGTPVMLIGDSFTQFNPETSTVEEVSEEKRALFVQQIAANPSIEIIAGDPQAEARLAELQQGVDELRQQVVAEVEAPLPHVRVPGAHHVTGELLQTGSLIAPHVARSFVEKANGVGLAARIGLVNAGGVRKDINQGALTVADVYELMPFGNTVFVLDLTGAEIKAMLETVIARALNPESTGAFPYLSSARFAADAARPAGQKVTEVQIAAENGQWELLSPDATYRVATLGFIAGGGDGYAELAAASGYRYDTGFIDAEAFMEYASSVGALAAPEPSIISFVAPE